MTGVRLGWLLFAALLAIAPSPARADTYNTVIATIGVGAGPFGVAVSPDGLETWVALTGGSGGPGNNVAVINNATHAVTTIATAGHSPVALAFTPDGQRVYVTNNRSGNVTVIDRATHGFQTIPLGLSDPDIAFIAINPTGTKAYVANSGNTSGTTVSVISIPDHTVSQIAVGNHPIGVAFTPSGNRAYVTNCGDNTVSVIDPLTDTVIATIAALGVCPAGIAVTADGTRAYVVNGVSGSLSVIDTVTNAVTSFSVGPINYGLAITPDGTRAYVPMAGANAIAVVNLATKTLVTTISTGASSAPSNIAINLAGSRAYTGNESNGTVSVIDTVPIMPTAHAGPDQTITENSVVQLDGNASTGANLTFLWEQLAGPPVTLSATVDPKPSFTSPDLAGGFGSQTLTFRVTVRDAAGATDSDSVDITVVNINHAPVAEPGADQRVKEGSLVTLDGSSSYDPDVDPITYRWEQTGGQPVMLNGMDTARASFAAPLLAGGIGGATELTFALTVSDGAMRDTKSITVTVEQVDHAPVADAGRAQTVNVGDVVTLDGRASSDPDGDAIVSYVWTQTAGYPVILDTTNAAQPVFTAPSSGGVIAFALTVSDGVLPSSNNANVSIAVVDANPRCGQAYASTSVLWPPDHRMVPVSVRGVTNPANEPLTIAITGVTQDEPVNGLGDGDTAPDALIQGSSVLLRAERAGGGDGRVYRIHFRASDDLGVPCTGSVAVSVPHDQGRGKTAVDSGQSYDATSR